jgi:hypothetical protein
MSRMIRIDSCNSCPHCDILGDFDSGYEFTCFNPDSYGVAIKDTQDKKEIVPIPDTCKLDHLVQDPKN